MVKKLENLPLQPPNYSTSPERRLRVGVVGCGEVAQIMHWPSLYYLADRFEVTALCDVSPSVVETLGHAWKVPFLTTDYRELIARTDVDAVLVATPNAYHAVTVLDAVVAGKHVLVEKPMCMTFREAEGIVAAQKQHGVVVQVGYMRRYAPAFLDACQAVQKIGEIKFARVRDFIGKNSLIVNPTSRVVRDDQVPASVRAEAASRENGLLEEALGGRASKALKRAYNLLLGLSSHDLSAMRELLGKPLKVLFAAQRGKGTYLAAAFDYGPFVCQFETGIDEIARFDAHLAVYGTNQVLQVQYDTPYVRNSPVRLFVLENNQRGGVNTVSSHPAWGDPFVEQWKAFYDHVVSGTEPKTHPTDFVQDLEIFAEMMRLMRD